MVRLFLSVFAPSRYLTNYSHFSRDVWVRPFNRCPPAYLRLEAMLAGALRVFTLRGYAGRYV